MVLPDPLGPSRPKTSPWPHGQAHAVDRGQPAEPDGDLAGVDDRPGRLGAASQLIRASARPAPARCYRIPADRDRDLGGHARLEHAARVVHADLGGEDLMPALVDALDVPRGELALVRDLGDMPAVTARRGASRPSPRRPGR